MARKVGFIDIRINGKFISFEIYYLKNAMKGYERKFDVINPSYWCVISSNDVLQNFSPNKSYGLGRMGRFIDVLLKEDGGVIIRKKVSEEVERIIEREKIIVGLENRQL
jgi:hypothetical protein